MARTLSRLVLPAAAIAAAAAIAVLVRAAPATPAAPGGDRTAPAPEPQAASASATAAELAHLRAELAALRDEVHHRAADDDAADDDTTADPADPAVAAAAFGTALEDSFAAEPVDAAWSGAMARALDDAFAAPALAGSSLVAARCRASLCRLEIAHADATAQDRFVGAASLHEAFRGAGAARPLVDPDHPDDLRTLVFLARDGHDLPTL